MASGNGDPVYGLPYTGTLVSPAPTTPRVQTVFNMYRMVPETITIQSGDAHYTQANSNSQRKGDLYHE